MCESWNKRIGCLDERERRERGTREGEKDGRRETGREEGRGKGCALRHSPFLFVFLSHLRLRTPHTVFNGTVMSPSKFNVFSVCTLLFI